MTKKEIENYLSKHQMNPKQRIDKERGGQYLYNLLYEFAEYVKNKTKSDMIGAIRKIKLD